MQYKVVPFIAAIDPKKGRSSDVAIQLEQLINRESEEGWNYVRLESVTTFVAADNGCFNLGLIGTSPSYTASRQVVVFSKQ